MRGTPSACLRPAFFKRTRIRPAFQSTSSSAGRSAFRGRLACTTVTPVTPLAQPAVERHFALVEIDSLKRYENADLSRIASLVQSLKSQELLIDPIVADVESGVLIDGHHRAAAFEWMGLKRIPCFAVRYDSPQIRVRGWMRASTAPASTVAKVFNSLSHPNDGDWRVVAMSSNDGGVAAAASFRHPSTAAHFLERVVACLQSCGHRETLVPRTGAPADVDRGSWPTAIYLDPVPGRTQVLEAIGGDSRLFPQQVNRHLVDGRPLNVRIPVDAVTGPGPFNEFLQRRERESEICWKTGAVHLGRWFEERVQFWLDISARA